MKNIILILFYFGLILLACNNQYKPNKQPAKLAIETQAEIVSKIDSLICQWLMIQTSIDEYEQAVKRCRYIDIEQRDNYNSDCAALKQIVSEYNAECVKLYAIDPEFKQIYKLK